MIYVRKSSPFWYLLPIFLGFVGGIISYFILKNTDQQRAKRCIIIGIIFSIPLASWIGLQIIFGTQNPFFVVFDRPAEQGKVQIARVVAIIDDNPVTLRTKGDANPTSISGIDFPITEDEYIGKVVNVFPQVGYITRIFTAPVNYIIFSIFVGVVMLKLGIGHRNYRKSLSSKIIPPSDDTQFWVCPNCGSDTQMKNGRQFCPSCNVNLK